MSQFSPSQDPNSGQSGQLGANQVFQQSAPYPEPLAYQSQAPQQAQPPEGTWQPSVPPPSAPLPPPPFPQQQQSGAYQPQMQQAMYPGQPVMVMPQQIVNVNIQQKQHGMLVRI